jgi:hypothetical protein
VRFPGFKLKLFCGGFELPMQRNSKKTRLKKWWGKNNRKQKKSPAAFL